MTPEIINFIDWVAIVILVIATVRFIIKGIAIWNTDQLIIRKIEIAAMRGEIKNDPLDVGKELISIIFTILWLAVM